MCGSASSLVIRQYMYGKQCRRKTTAHATRNSGDIQAMVVQRIRSDDSREKEAHSWLSPQRTSVANGNVIGERCVDFREVLLGQLDGKAAGVLFEPRDLSCARDLRVQAHGFDIRARPKR